MKTVNVHTLILGAGPSGLAAGYILAKAGAEPIVLERDKVCGGLMRSIHRGDFVVDVGRKELYNRLAKVDALWSEILGADYRHYPHRGGILYEGQIIDMSPAYKGFRRGMPWGMFFGCAPDFLRAQATGRRVISSNLEEYFYQKRGRRLTQIFAQGFQEKLSGKSWKEIPSPQASGEGDNVHAGVWQSCYQLLTRIFAKSEVNTYEGVWRHPAKGTGQICDALAQGMQKNGGDIAYEARVLEMTTNAGRIDGVTAEIASETVLYRPRHVVSSIPLEFLLRLLFPQHARAGGDSQLPGSRQAVILVYLFLDEEPRFPHMWLQVTCPSTRIGRITNYAAFNGEMVPKGKTCLCCEYYCFGKDSLLEMDTAALLEQTLDYCARAKLINRTKCVDHLVLKLPGADASQNRDNWINSARLQKLGALERFDNLYFVQRPETDIATLAGIEAAEAILSGNRAEFDRRLDPSMLPIRSESKAFSFDAPVPSLKDVSVRQ
jgi:protoporphyrinogen oxidase